MATSILSAARQRQPFALSTLGLEILPHLAVLHDAAQYPKTLATEPILQAVTSHINEQQPSAHTPPQLPHAHDSERSPPRSPLRGRYKAYNSRASQFGATPAYSTASQQQRQQSQQAQHWQQPQSLSRHGAHQAFSSPQRQPLVIIGPPGSGVCACVHSCVYMCLHAFVCILILLIGRTTAMARVVMETIEKHPNVAVVARVIGATIPSTHLPSLLHSLCTQVCYIGNMRYNLLKVT